MVVIRVTLKEINLSQVLYVLWSVGNTTVSVCVAQCVAHWPKYQQHLSLSHFLWDTTYWHHRQHDLSEINRAYNHPKIIFGRILGQSDIHKRKETTTKWDKLITNPLWAPEIKLEADILGVLQWFSVSLNTQIMRFNPQPAATCWINILALYETVCREHCSSSILKSESAGIRW